MCLARRLAHGLDRGAAGLARHQLAEFVKVDCEGMSGVSKEVQYVGKWGCKSVSRGLVCEG